MELVFNDEHDIHFNLFEKIIYISNINFSIVKHLLIKEQIDLLLSHDRIFFPNEILECDLKCEKNNIKFVGKAYITIISINEIVNDEIKTVDVLFDFKKQFTNITILSGKDICYEQL